jgi:hypothetical protein
MTVYHRLTGPLSFRVRHLQWVPHFLSDAQEAIRVENSQSLLRTLQDQQDRVWHNVVTMDESWFDDTTDHESIWFPADEKVPERERTTVQSKKPMVTIVWNLNGLH